MIKSLTFRNRPAFVRRLLSIRGLATFPTHTFGDEKAKGAVVVLQEWWGVNEEVKQQAEKVANFGYLVVIPDLYRGKVTLETAEANHLMNELDFKKTAMDLSELVASLKSSEPRRRVGVMGFCMGGALSLASAAESATMEASKRVDAAISFYGTPPEQFFNIKGIKCPVQAHFGELDAFEFANQVASTRLKSLLQEAGVYNEVYEYAGQGHAFMNTTAWYAEKRKELQLPKADEALIQKAWERVEKFLKRTIDN